MQIFPALPVPGLISSPFVIPNDGINAQHRGTSASGFHRIERGFRAAEKAARFGLPPRVHDDRFAFANRLVIPAPDFRFDRFANGSHVLEVIVIFFRLVAAGFAQHADRSRRSVKNINVEPFSDAPRASGIGELRHTFIENACGGESEWAIDDVGMPGDPANVGHTPVNVVEVNVLVIL